MNKKGLFHEFDAVSAKAWKQKIQVELKGEDYNEKLVWESPEGIKVKPFYHPEDLQELHINPSLNRAKWKIGQAISVEDAILGNASAKESIDQGVESLILTITNDQIDIVTLLNGIDLAKITIQFNFLFLSVGYIKQIVEVAGAHVSNIFFNLDIIGHLCRTGNWYSNNKNDHKHLLESLEYLKEQSALAIDTSVYQNAGAHCVQQLAYAMAHANEYLNFLSHNNALSTLGAFNFKVSIGGNYFFEIAKIRALRLLWDTIKEPYDISHPCHITAIPTKRNKTIYDYNLNMLRTTTEAMSAILGGANTVCAMPYDTLFQNSNDFGDRIARNQLLILKHESYFDKVSNVSEGSYYIETLTHELAKNALALFKSIEKGGGFIKQLLDHTIQKKVSESAKKEQEKFDSHENVLIGTNKYADPSDLMKNNLEISPFTKSNVQKTSIQPLLAKRLAVELEKERIAAE